MNERKRTKPKFPKSRQGKIARLPWNIREELNRRMLDNQPLRKICEWVNGLPETIAQCAERKLAPVTWFNLSSWRQGGYQDWLGRTERTQHVRELARWSLKLARANDGHLSEGAAAILAGQILSVLESLAKLQDKIIDGVGDIDIAEWQSIAKMMNELGRTVSGLRRGDQERVKIGLNKKVIGQRDEAQALNREKFELLACGRMLEEGQRKKVEEIANATISYEDKIKAIRAVAFASVDELERSGRIVIPD